uniref:Histone-lysine N-methyltransferase SETMAR n=1 Tax=Caenorhabditis japonica TaxID=281687 RepID=A0A8R1DQY3_CAEJA
MLLPTPISLPRAPSLFEKSARDAPLSTSFMTTRAYMLPRPLQELNWYTVPHPPYSPDIAPSDYHLFRPLKLFLKEKRFAKYKDLKMAVFDFFDSQSAAFWKKGIGDLFERWLTVVTDGHYIVD